MMYQSDQLLPPSTILEKLKTLDSGAAENIFGRVDVIAATRRERERKELSSLRHAIRPFFQGMAMAFAPVVKMAPEKRPEPAVSINFSYAAVGNDIRVAIHNYLEEHQDIATKITLTDVEKKSLELLSVPGYSKPPQKNFG